jgi:hypothetical protein
MLFDLSSGRRKRVVQVVYATLAILMGGSLVLFGIGSDAPGGILDALGLGSNSTNDSDPRYEQQIEDAESTLETDPENPAALLELARYKALTGQAIVAENTDPETGAVQSVPEAESNFNDAADAWNRYLETKPAKPDPTVAATMVQAFVAVGDAEGATKAQEIFAAEQNVPSAYANLALYAYSAFDFKTGDEASDKAVQLSEPADRKEMRKQLDDLAERARKFKKQEDKAAEAGGKEAGEAQITDPFGALGGSGSAVPTPTPTPAP